MKTTHAMLTALAPLMLAGCAGLTDTASAPASLTEVESPPQLLFNSVMSCSGETAEIGVANDQNILRAGGRDYVLEPVETASGAKYVAVGDPETSFWSKGEGGTLTVAGVSYPDCVLTGGYAYEVAETAEPAALPPGLWRAQGNEPGWVLTLDGEMMALNYNYGAGSVTLPQPEAADIEGGMQWTSEGGAMMVTALKTVCADNMTGMPYPAIVTVDYDGQTFRGCGGSPKSLLAGDWTIRSINGEAVIADSGASMTFDANAEQISATAGCNMIGAPFLLTGESLTFGPARSSMMACDDPLMAQERALVDTLGAVSAFSIGDDGALTLSGAGGTITAQR